MIVIRWILVPLTALAVWAAALLLGLVAVNLLDRLCPPHLMESGFCTVWWYQPAMTLLEMLCAGIAAAGVVVVPALVAPAYRIHIATIFFIGGAVFTTALARAGGLWWPFVAAAVAGSLALYACATRWRRPHA